MEPLDEARQRSIHDALVQLETPNSPAGQAALRMLVTFTGQHNANTLQTAVSDHSAAAVQAAATATADKIASYRTQGLSDAAVLAAFQQGEAATAIREASETPLSDAALAAVADMVLLPQRRLTRPELAQAIGQAAMTDNSTADRVAESLGMPIGFGGQTGNVRGVLAGVRAMQLVARRAGPTGTADSERAAQPIPAAAWARVVMHPTSFAIFSVTWRPCPAR